MSLPEKTNSAREILKGEKGLTKRHSSEMASPNEAKAKEAFDEAQKACIMPMMGQNTRPRKCHVYLLS
jgi:hypothetical protein